MKTTNFLWVGLISLATIFSCQNEEINENQAATSDTVLDSKREAKESVHRINHVYNYYGEKFKVTYVYDEERKEVLEAEGDTHIAEKIFSDEEKNPKSLFFTNPKEKSTEIEVNVFDNQEDLNKYASEVAGGLPDVKEKSNRRLQARNCTSTDWWGTGRFYFYQHAYYNSSMNGMNRFNRYYYRDHWVGNNHNDRLSSLIVTKPREKKALVYLYQHGCYDGRVIGFYQSRGYSGFGVANLSWYTLSGWWFWRKSWNDQVSSTSGWAW